VICYSNSLAFSFSICTRAFLLIYRSLEGDHLHNSRDEASAYAKVGRMDNLTGTSMFIAYEACRYHRLRDPDPVR